MKKIIPFLLCLILPGVALASINNAGNQNLYTPSGYIPSQAAANAANISDGYMPGDHPKTGQTVIANKPQTVYNKRIPPRAVTITQSATPAIFTDSGDVFEITGIAQAITSMTTNLTGNPKDGEIIEIEFTDNGTARAITWGSSFSSTTVTLPTTTVISTQLNVFLQWSASAAKWYCVGTA